MKCIKQLYLWLYMFYCRANQEWQWRNTSFTIAMWNINLYTPLELMWIDRSLEY